MNHEARQRAAHSHAMTGGRTDYQAHEDRPRECWQCEGTGVMEVEAPDGRIGHDRCDECDGEGVIE